VTAEAVAATSVVELLAAARAGLRRLDPRAALAATRAGAVLVDIRPAAQRAEEGEVPEAMTVERNVLEWRFDPSSDARLAIASYDLSVVVLCSEGYTSSLAAAALQQVGVARATDVIGGFQAWQAAGLPTAGGAAARHLSAVPAPVPAVDLGLVVRPDERRAFVHGTEVDLTRLEFDLLTHLLAEPQRVHTRAALLSALWDGRPGSTRTVDVHVHRLRTKLGELAGTALQTVRGVGYRWSPPAVR
jgi:rhodanese-related sulfurtransferase